MTHDDLFRNGVALLAFVIAFYALIARERKTPDMVHAVYRIAFLVLGALLLSLSADFAETLITRTSTSAYGSGTATPHEQSAAPADTQQIASLAPARPRWLSILSWSSPALLGAALLLVLARLYKDRNRQVFFRDDQVLANTFPARWWTARQLSKRTTPRYQTNPMRLPPSLITSLSSIELIGAERMQRVVNHHQAAEDLSISAVFDLRNLIEIDNLLCDIATRFLEEGFFVQYTSCSRHPLEFLLQLRSRWNAGSPRTEWKVIQNKIVAVDGYTPHFGFTDTVYHDRALEAKNLCLAYVTSTRTYAGVHTAIANAFNHIMAAEKTQSPKAQVRTPTLVIYEGCSALIDLESDEQYRIFTRHVIPSERLWGGMFTVFVESGISEANRAVLEASADIFVQRQ